MYNNHMDKCIYTIGYTAFDINSFIVKLKELNISCVIDVRSNPVASEFYENYSRINLEPLLKQHNIYYRNYANEFGARQTNNKFYEKYGYLDFAEFIKTQQFISGVEKIEKGLKLGYNFVLMCAEKDPIACHRTIMVGKGMKDMGFDIKHIMADNSIQSQVDIENRLLDLYFPNRGQLNIFEQKTEEEYIAEAYLKQNAKIGYKREKEVA